MVKVMGKSRATAMLEVSPGKKPMTSPPQIPPRMARTEVNEKRLDRTVRMSGIQDSMRGRSTQQPSDGQLDHQEPVEEQIDEQDDAARDEAV